MKQAWHPPEAVKLLLPVWGYRYVNQWLDFSLPTLLATGNIPALAKELPCEFVLMTRAEDLGRIEQHPVWARLSDICPAHVHLIDHLIVERNHHVTITRAFAEAVRSSGQAIRDTCFLFLVSDCLFANGSLMHVLSQLLSGANGVVSGHIQVLRDNFKVSLKTYLHPSSPELELSPRELMRLALADIHPAASSSMVNQEGTCNRNANRFFWKVDADTIIGRFYLMHMIGIRPETENFFVGASCDYSFIPEMCPSGNVAVITDSDDYAAVEMQPRDPELSDHDGTRLTPKELARCLSEWTTVQHRENARHTLVFHAADIPETVSKLTTEADVFIGGIDCHLSRKPQPHRNHPSWIVATAVHRASAGSYTPLEEPREPIVGRGLTASFLEALWHLRLTAFGRPPNVRPWHPRWPDFWLPLSTIRSLLIPSSKLVVISNQPATFGRWLEQVCPHVTTLDSSHLLDSGNVGGPADGGGFDVGLMIVQGKECGNAAIWVDRAREFLKPDAVLALVLTNDIDDVFNRHGLDLSLSMPSNALSNPDLRVRTMRYVIESRLRRSVTEAMRYLAKAIRLRPWMVFPLAPVGCVLAFASLSCNCVALLRHTTPSRSSVCSSVFILMNVREAVRQSVPVA